MTPRLADDEHRQAAIKNAERKNVIEGTARLFYATFAVSIGGDYPAWENLSEPTRVAWRAVVEFADANPECIRCGDSLLCMSCDADQVGETIATALKPEV